jgi:hypothetical protein
MHPAGSDGKMVLSSGPVCARPRLSALIPPAPKPRLGGGVGKRGFRFLSMPGNPPWRVLPEKVVGNRETLFYIITQNALIHFKKEFLKASRFHLDEIRNA